MGNNQQGFKGSWYRNILETIIAESEISVLKKR